MVQRTMSIPTMSEKEKKRVWKTPPQAPHKYRSKKPDTPPHTSKAERSNSPNHGFRSSPDILQHNSTDLEQEICH